MKLTLLIPTLPKRAHLLNRLLQVLLPQVDTNEIEILFNSDRGCTIGEKRNRMVAQAQGKYIAFIDDDDLVSNNYISQIMEGIDKDVDCCGLTGLYKPDNGKAQTFIHSIQYKEFFERDNVLYRCPNHLNAVKREHAIKCPFPHWDYSEDSNYAFQLRDAGLLKTEHMITDIIYTYEFVSDKRY
jgi:glycosyltransferase involved in cell wall biosynthesis